MRRICLFLCVGLALLLTVGCAPRHADWFAPFKQGFCAEVTGELYDLQFSAAVEAAPITETGILPLTVTFYAPQELAGTVLARDASGAVTLSAGGVTVPVSDGFEKLLQAFPADGRILQTELTEEGYTRLHCADIELTLLPDGTPYMLSAADLLITVLQWQK